MKESRASNIENTHTHTATLPPSLFPCMHTHTFTHTHSHAAQVDLSLLKYLELL